MRSDDQVADWLALVVLALFISACLYGCAAIETLARG